jgi:hypothetical protein
MQAHGRPGNFGRHSGAGNFSPGHVGRSPVGDRHSGDPHSGDLQSGEPHGGDPDAGDPDAGEAGGGKVAGGVSLEAEVPEVLFQGMRDFLSTHPQWDQYRLITSALAGFLFQNGCNDRCVTEHYLDALFLRQ